MVPSFNTTGPCVPGLHYMLPPGERLATVLTLIEEGKFFVFHAGNKTGKTTCAQWLVKHLNSGERYACAWVDLQTAREQPDPKRALRTVQGCLDHALRRDLPGLDLPPPWTPEVDPADLLLSYLRTVAQRSPRPLVLLLDEADGLIGEAMVSFLTQLRAGYLDRADSPFPYSVVLVGRKLIRDYALSVQDRQTVAWLGSASPFNITAQAAQLPLFTPAQVLALLLQHTTATGQVFSPAAGEHLCALTRGQPWLVNALADQIVSRDVTDRAVTIAPEHVDAAKETLILERRTHIDALLARLREERVQRIILPMLLGESLPADLLDDDTAYVLSLGLCAVQGGMLQIQNPIYREVIPRTLTYAVQISLNQEPRWYRTADGRLDVAKLLAAWQRFWREDGHLAARGFLYREAGPHLMLMAFLQRVVNGGGQVEREYGLGRGALDLLLRYGGERHAIEIKVRRGDYTLEQGLRRLSRYLGLLGLAEGWLVLFERRKKIPWEERIYQRELTHEGKLIHLIGC